jgi:hypothetical protein
MRGYSRLTVPRMLSVAGFCDYGNELSNSTKGGEPTDSWQAVSVSKRTVFNEVIYILCRIFKTENCINITVIYKIFSSTTFAFYCNGFVLISEISVGFNPVNAFRCVPGEKLLSLFLFLSLLGGGEMVFGKPRYPRRYSDSLWAGRQRNRSSIPGRDKILFFWPKCPNRLLDPPTLPYNG